MEERHRALFVTATAIIPLAAWMGRRRTIWVKGRARDRGLLNATSVTRPKCSSDSWPFRKAWSTSSKLRSPDRSWATFCSSGSSILAGGVRYPHQHYNQTATRSATSLTMAVIGLMMPTIFHESLIRASGWAPHLEQGLSLGIAVVLFLTYISGCCSRRLRTGSSSAAKRHDVSEDAGVWSVSKAVIILAAATLLLAILSEFLTDPSRRPAGARPHGDLRRRDHRRHCRQRGRTFHRHNGRAEKQDGSQPRIHRPELANRAAGQPGWSSPRMRLAIR